MFLVNLMQLFHKGRLRRYLNYLILLFDFIGLEFELVDSEAHCFHELDGTPMKAAPLRDC